MTAREQPRFEVNDEELELIARARERRLSPRELAGMLWRSPTLAGEIALLAARSAIAALSSSSALSSLIYATQVRRVAPDAAVGAGWYPPHGFVAALREHLDPGCEALELGCGSGRVSRLVAPHVARLVATDVSPTMVREARRNLAGVANTCARVTDGRTLREFATESFDVVFAAGMFGYVESSFYLALLAEVARVLRPGGRLVFNEMLLEPGTREAEHLLDVSLRSARKGRISGTIERPYCRAQLAAWCDVAGLSLVGATPSEPDSAGLSRTVILAVRPGAS